MLEPDSSSTNQPDCSPAPDRPLAEATAGEPVEAAPSANAEKAGEATKEAAARRKRANLCRTFEKSGSCRYGDKCRFVHERPLPGDEEETDAGNADNGQESQPQLQGKQQQGDTTQKEVCRFYSKAGWCRNGRRCRFLHERTKRTSTAKNDVKGETEADVPQATVAESSQDAAVNTAEAETKSVGGEKTAEDEENQQKKKTEKRQRKKMCRYFKAGHCRLAERCVFLHVEAEGTSAPTTKAGPSPNPSPSPSQPRPAQPRPSAPTSADQPVSLRAQDIGEEDLAGLRTTEVAQLVKRFTKDKLTVTEKEDGETVYRININPTDPDWPFDMRDFELELTFPERYPLEPFAVSMPEDQVLPNIVLQYMSTNMAEWVLARHGINQISGKVELMFRPFLRWLDRNLEKLFTEAAKKFKMDVDAKAAGIELVPYAKKKPEEITEVRHCIDPQHPDDSEGVPLTSRTALPPGTDTGADVLNADTSTEQAPSGETQNGSEGSGERATLDDANRPDPAPSADLTNVQRRGTEVKLAELRLSEGVATLVARRLALTVQCSRCRARWDLATPPRRLNAIPCGQCRHQQLVTFRQSMVHGFASTLGFLDLEGCTAFDLILSQCSFAVSCLSCSEESQVEGLQSGQLRTLWCEKCHAKMTLQLQAVKFQQLQVQATKADGSDKAHVIQVKQLRKQVHPDIHEGHPLPRNGTCRHFKKSFRWLRFPCCAKCYPCDECHLENEPDHEMKYANRMICGFCCKEQQYTLDKPCISCGSMTTKGKTSHWEGGTGCRNKTKMNKTDKQKYTSLAKTTSRKKQNKETSQKAN